MNYEFTMPWPPSVNAWKTPFRNRMILTKRGRDYRASVLAECEKLGLTGENLSSGLSVNIELNPPTLRRYDVDNFTKSIFDALTKAEFWIDDEQVQRLLITKGSKVEGGNINLKVEVIE